MGFPRQEYWSGLPFPSPGDLPDPGLEPTSPPLAGGFLTTEPYFSGKEMEQQCMHTVRKRVRDAEQSQSYSRLEVACVRGQRETLCSMSGPPRTRVPLLIEGALAAGVVVLLARVRAVGGLLGIITGLQARLLLFTVVLPWLLPQQLLHGGLELL